MKTLYLLLAPGLALGGAGAACATFEAADVSGGDGDVHADDRDGGTAGGAAGALGGEVATAGDGDDGGGAPPVGGAQEESDGGQAAPKPKTTCDIQTSTCTIDCSVQDCAGEVTCPSSQKCVVRCGGGRRCPHVTCYTGRQCIVDCAAPADCVGGSMTQNYVTIGCVRCGACARRNCQNCRATFDFDGGCDDSCTTQPTECAVD